MIEPLPPRRDAGICLDVYAISHDSVTVEYDGETDDGRSFKVRAILKPEIVQWCDENFVGTYAWDQYTAEMLLSHERDAVLFKLRWA